MDRRAFIQAAGLTPMLALDGHITPPEREPATRDLWVLLLVENHGTRVKVGGIFPSQDAAHAAAAALPPPETDRLALPVPATFYQHQIAVHHG